MAEQPKTHPPRPDEREAARRNKKRRKRHLDELLDEALDETFPASDPPAMLEPAPNSRRGGEHGDSEDGPDVPAADQDQRDREPR